ncbi:MAG: exodeoxyribonuclease V subunit gamma, partial [Verrucomicrobiota bacterium]|nr:exodeoxyribonuclease V subunit gamma [Verrucomicrobiota bacterium]
MQFERGNPLLASYGKLGRQFLETVTDLQPAKEIESFEVPPNDSVLTQIQRDIFELHNPLGETKRAIATDDHSLQFRSCHSPMREMEVLHDQLLALFEQNSALKPHDIVVMAPDIGVYAPFIGAVFDTAPEALRIPFTIADRGARAENGVLDTFMRILELAGSRFTANSVLGVLESSALRRRFEIADSDLETIRTWIAKTGIRWGIDAEQRAALGLPAFAENSWRAGLDRLLLGYAAPARGEKLFEGILAYDNVEGGLAETLGRFVEFSEALFAAAGTLDRPRALLDWQETLRQIALRFFSPDDEREPELRQLRRVLDSLGETATLAGFTDAVPLDVLLAHLAQALANTDSGSRFLDGRVTFCALKPMRTVPFRVVCLVGMNATAYPRHTRAPGFDLIAQNPRPGDRSTRDDDRYLFLEALLSARETFYVSYVGQSIRDNSALPPSVLVSELLDYAEETFAVAEATPLVRRHRLQPFSAEYFHPGGGLFSYSQENCAAGVAAAGERATPPVFIQSPLGEPEPELRQLDAETLIRFFGNPAKFFAQQRLDLRTPREESALEDFEPLEIDGLDKYILQQDLLQRALADQDFDQLLPVIRANGELPPAHAGESRLRQMIDAAEKFGELVRQHLGSGRAEARDVQLEMEWFTLRARFDKIYDGRLVHYRQTTCKPKDLLTAWIYHLVANCEAETPSILITADKYGKPVEHHFASVEPAFAHDRLQELLELYWRGLREPLPFYPKSSLAFAEASLNDKDALAAARKIWERVHYENDGGAPAESEEPYLALAFRNVAEPFGENFQETTRAIFLPILKAMQS